MKRFLNGVMEWKTYACFMFTGSLILYMFIAFITGESALGLANVFSLLIVSALGIFIQFLAFSDYVIKKMLYSRRIMVFVALFLPMITICALCFKWFPAEYAMSWIVFIGIFLVIFIICTLSFEVYFRATGKKYDGLLGQYKKQKEQR